MNMLAVMNRIGFITNSAFVTVTNADPMVTNNVSRTVVQVTPTFVPFFRISRLSVGVLTYSFLTETGVSYEIQYSHTPGVTIFVRCRDFNDCPTLPPLPMEPWFTLTNFTGDGALKTFFDPSPAPDLRFYRLRLH
jgi:hypothetical protein